LIKLVYSKRYKETKFLKDKIIELKDFIDLKGMKVLGNQLTKLPLKEIILLKPKDSEVWEMIEPKKDTGLIEEDDHVIEDIAIDNIEEQVVSDIKEVGAEEKKPKKQPKEIIKEPAKKAKKQPEIEPKKETAKPKAKKKIKLEPEKAFEVEFEIENPEVVELDSSEKSISIDLDVDSKNKKKPKSNPKPGKGSKKVIKPNDDDEEDQMTLF